MKKRSSSKTSVVSHPNFSYQPIDDSNNVLRNGSFVFSNGDRYEGEYTISGEPPYLLRQGRGIYYTEDFDKYECLWDGDKFGEDLHIRFNNDTEYKGATDENGRIHGQGTYFFPDGSSITAEWMRNKLFRNIRYKEPLGFVWKGEFSEDKKEIRFTPGNHFWDDMESA